MEILSQIDITHTYIILATISLVTIIILIISVLLQRYGVSVGDVICLEKNKIVLAKKPYPRDAMRIVSKMIIYKTSRTFRIVAENLYKTSTKIEMYVCLPSDRHSPVSGRVIHMGISH